jgi:hypothetical protein
MISSYKQSLNVDDISLFAFYMIDLPLDVLHLIAEYFKPSELLSLAAFHRHFLYELLNSRYRSSVVLRDNLQKELKLDKELSLIG